TQKNYAAGRAHFHQWCTAERIALRKSEPIPEPVLCAYAAAMAGVCAGGTARSRLAALHFWHDRHGLAWAGSQRLLRILKAVTTATPPASKREERPPVTEAMLDEALHSLDPHRPFDVCVAAAMLVMFWCQLRLGEILSQTRKYDFGALPSVQGVRLRADAGGTLDRVTSALWLPRTKVERSGVWVWIARHYNDPSFALQDHIRVNRLEDDDPLFAYRHDTTHELIPLTRAAFLGRLNEIWAACGMQRVTGHCFRIGGTTALLRAGVDPEVVKVAGRWKSDSFLRYWRALDQIISSHM
ncbi:DNA breaking-rejoining enzyme, partial [Exidia glandulosa HHB12029]